MRRQGHFRQSTWLDLHYLDSFILMELKVLFSQYRTRPARTRSPPGQSRAADVFSNNRNPRGNPHAWPTGSTSQPPWAFQAALQQDQCDPREHDTCTCTPSRLRTRPVGVETPTRRALRFSSTGKDAPIPSSLKPNQRRRRKQLPRPQRFPQVRLSHLADIEGEIAKKGLVASGFAHARTFMLSFFECIPNPGLTRPRRFATVVVSFLWSVHRRPRSMLLPGLHNLQ